MATITDNLACDATVATGLSNFVNTFGNIGGSGSKGVSYALSTLGFIQQNEPGQVQWTTNSKTLSSITGNGTIWTGTTSAAHGFRPNQVVTIANTTHFNGNFILATASGTTFTITNSTNNGTTDNAGGQTAAIQAITKVPDILPSNTTTQQSTGTSTRPTAWQGIWASGSTYSIGDVVWFNTGTDYNVFTSITNSNHANSPTGGASDTNWKLYAYEIWKSNDGLTAFYLKFEYGQSQTAVPGMSFQIGTSVSSTSTLGGNLSFRDFLGNSATATGSTSTFACYFSGGQNASPFTASGNNFQMLMWQNATTSIQTWFLAIEREKDNNGNDTSSSINYVVGFGPNNGTGGFHTNNLQLSGANPIAVAQQTSTFPADAASSQWGTWSVQQNAQVVGYNAFNQIGIWPSFGWRGYVTNPLLCLMTAAKGDVTEASSFSITVYGASHTYLPTKNTWVNKSLLNGGATPGLASCASTAALCMRYE